MAQRPQGTFVSLSESDKEQLRRLIAGGLSLRAAVQEVGCNYQHAYFFAHCEASWVWFREVPQVLFRLSRWENLEHAKEI
ncbi:hypothetical protein MHK10_10135 [Corynebacterium striatum]|uniref:hypothetical protein n=1 Tax=Corynebacterium striatum TaxID=43770 RepID=UPI001EF58EBE|nr:hypothetical protein [Corynebacterium striatum]MCG7250656.1 hypothetical protein [Corynebacterium striatum]